MNGYTIEIAKDGFFYLMHGQSTPGFNNGVRVRCLEDVWRISETWKTDGIPTPYPTED